jgi:D-glycero-alpha-D-manno-heptose 1-phosphate guanylyltransferase
MEAIILAGGLGTRLRSVVKDHPKALASLGEFPFLYYLIRYLQNEGVTRFIFSLGYLHDQIETFLQEYFAELDYVTVIEDSPLGTGGAIKLCLSHVEGDEALLVNADTFFEIKIQQLYGYFKGRKADCVIALTELTNFDRYGIVKIDSESRVLEFIEKKATDRGLINTGLILFNKEVFSKLFDAFDGVFSFEKDILEPNIQSLEIFGMAQDGFFIDIGIPEDYLKARQEISFFENIIKG